MSDKRQDKPGFFRSLMRILTARPDVPESLEENETLQVVMNRRSVRKFTSQPIPDEVLDVILEAGRMAPSGVNLQTWTFICFMPDEWEEKFGRSIPFNGQLAILVLSDLHRLSLLRETLDFPDEPLTLHTLAVFNAGLAAMNMNLAAEACGVSSIMLSETGQTGMLDAGMLAQALDLPGDAVPLTTLVLGYKAPGALSAIPPRLPLEMIHGEAAYPSLDEDALRLWLGDLQAGYKAMRPWTSFTAQVRTYRKKIHQAEEDLRRLIFRKPSE
jgi:hypothetical protein